MTETVTPEGAANDEPQPTDLEKARAELAAKRVKLAELQEENAAADRRKLESADIARIDAEARQLQAEIDFQNRVKEAREANDAPAEVPVVDPAPGAEVVTDPAVVAPEVENLSPTDPVTEAGQDAGVIETPAQPVTSDPAPSVPVTPEVPEPQQRTSVPTRPTTKEK